MCTCALTVYQFFPNKAVASVKSKLCRPTYKGRCVLLGLITMENLYISCAMSALNPYLLYMDSITKPTQFEKASFVYVKKTPFNCSFLTGTNTLTLDILADQLLKITFSTISNIHYLRPRVFSYNYFKPRRSLHGRTSQVSYHTIFRAQYTHVWVLGLNP